jgi:hypothetical protein
MQPMFEKQPTFLQPRRLGNDQFIILLLRNGQPDHGLLQFRNQRLGEDSKTLRRIFGTMRLQWGVLGAGHSGICQPVSQ